jgi:pyridoxamine 5'-phosphate oxidase
MSLAHLRREYTQAGLTKAMLEADPIEQFKSWFNDALGANVTEPNAMVLATVDSSGQPSARVVLLKEVDERGFQFFTNYESRKGRELAANPKAALNFAWLELERQVVVAGTVTKLSRDESAAYFRERPRGSRLGAWASQQSQVIANRDVLESRLLELENKYPSDDVPLPPSWGGYMLSPSELEFWQGRPSRLHDRLRYRRVNNGPWIIERLSP